MAEHHYEWSKINCRNLGYTLKAAWLCHETSFYFHWAVTVWQLFSFLENYCTLVPLSTHSFPFLLVITCRKNNINCWYIPHKWIVHADWLPLRWLAKYYSPVSGYVPHSSVNIHHYSPPLWWIIVNYSNKWQKKKQKKKKKQLKVHFSGIMQIMLHPLTRVDRLIGSFDAPWSKWSCITDPFTYSLGLLIWQVKIDDNPDVKYNQVGLTLSTCTWFETLVIHLLFIAVFNNVQTLKFSSQLRVYVFRCRQSSKQTSRETEAHFSWVKRPRLLVMISRFRSILVFLCFKVRWLSP